MQVNPVGDSRAATPSLPPDNSGAPSELAAQIEAARRGLDSPFAAFLQNSLDVAARDTNIPAAQIPNGRPSDPAGDAQNETAKPQPQAQQTASHWEGGVGEVCKELADKLPHTEGVQVCTNSASAQVRAAKIFKIGNKREIIIFLGDFKGTDKHSAPAFVEIRNTMNAAIPLRLTRKGPVYGPNIVERNRWPKFGPGGKLDIEQDAAIKKRLPFESKRTDRSPNNGNGTFSEWIDGADNITIGDSRKYIFPDGEKQAIQFVDEWSTKSNYFAAYNSQFGIREEFKNAYVEFAKKHGFEPKVAGSTQTLGRNDWVRLYFNADATAFTQQDREVFLKWFPELASKIEPVADLAGKSAGVYWAIDFNLRTLLHHSEQIAAPIGSAGSDWIDSFLQIFSPEDEFSSQAAQTYGFKFDVGARAFGGFFFADAFHGELSENSFGPGIAFHQDPYKNFIQMSLYFRYAHAGLDPQSEQQFNPLYWNRFPGNSKNSLFDKAKNKMFDAGTIQAMMGDLRTLNHVTDAEVRLPLDGGYSAEDNLLAAYLNKYDATSPRFEVIREIYEAEHRESPLSPAWEQAARKDYERIFNRGAVVDDATWKTVAYDQLTPSVWKLPFLSEEKRRWVSDNFTPERMYAYSIWLEKREQYKVDKKEEIEKMSFEQRYKAFYEFNLFCPNMAYIRKYAGAGDLKDYFFGVTIPKPTGAKSLAYGLTKGWTSEGNLRENMYSNVAVDLGHIRDYIEVHKKDPALGEAIDFLYNRYGYKRTDPSGEYIPRSPLTLAWFGYTNTRAIDDIQKNSKHWLDVSNMKNIYKVRPEDIVINDENKTWENLSRRALEQLGYRAIAPAKLKDYENLLRRVNFHNLPDQKNLKQYVFENALLALPSSYHLDDPNR